MGMLDPTREKHIKARTAGEKGLHRWPRIALNVGKGT